MDSPRLKGCHHHSESVNSPRLKGCHHHSNELPWRNIWLSDNPVDVLNEHLSLLVGRYVPTKVNHVRNKDKPWFDDQCRLAFGLKQEAQLIVSGLGLIGKSLSAIK